MTKETKVGLLVGTGMILLIGILVSDHLSVVQRQESARLTDFAPQSQEDLAPLPPRTAEPSAEVLPIAPAPATPQAQEAVPRPAVDPIDAMRQQQQPEASVAQAQPEQASPDVMLTQRIEQTLRQHEAHALAGVAPLQRPQFAPQAVDYAQATTIDVRDLEPVAVQPRQPARDTTVGPTQTGGQPAIYHVKPNDSLYRIAQTFYGDGEYWKVIAEANPKAVGADGGVRAGVRLVIPNRSALPAQGGAESTLVRIEQPTAVDAERTTTPRTAAGAITVQQGDTLSTLAERHLGSQGQWKKLFEANRDQLDDANDIRVGMKLRLPGQTTAPAPAPARAAPEAPAAVRPAVYVVKPGDTLSKIASKYFGDRERWREIFEANSRKLASPDDLKVGDTLVLPSRG